MEYLLPLAVSDGTFKHRFAAAMEWGQDRLSFSDLKVCSPKDPAPAVKQSVSIYDEDGAELIEETLDLVVEEVLIVELKAVREVSDADVAQLPGYLKAAGFRHGLLINFGAPKFFLKKYVM